MKNNKRIKMILIIMSFILINISTVYLLYGISLLKGIENIVRLVVAIILILIAIIGNLTYIRLIRKDKSKYFILFAITLIYSIILILLSNFILKAYKTIDNMTSDSTMYSSSLVTLSTNKVDDIKKINKGKIGILSDTTSIDGNQIPTSIIEEKKLTNEIKEYDSYINLIKGLYDKEVAYIFLPTNYVVMFQNMDGANLENIKTETKIIYTEQKQEKKEITNTNSSLDKPFTVLIMGVDSETEEIANSTFNGDSLMLLTFNPETLNTTILSIPRDSYVPIMCFPGQRKNKITHAAWYGQDCMISTIENFTGIKIDYYVKINFKGVVKLVDALGGVEVDVPYAFCEQNSNREFGSSTIYVEEGLQVLNGEQALAFSRNRHTWPEICGEKYSNYISNDFIRGQHQQEVLRSLLNKIKEVRSLNKVTELLNTISNNMETNMNTNEILSLYNVGKDILVKSKNSKMDELLGIQRLYLNGVGTSIYDPGMQLNLYNYIIYNDSLDAVTNAMKVNLGLIEPTIIKEFSFDIDEEYEEEVIGQNVYGTNKIVKLPSFIGNTEAEARASAAKLGISVNVKYDSTSEGTNNTVINQNYSEGTDVSTISSITLTILKKEEKKETTKDKVDSTKDQGTDTTDEDTNKNSNSTDNSDKTTSDDSSSSGDENNSSNTNNPSTDVDEIINNLN